jgi:DNA-binding NarL/FixJ family response regulator
MLRIVIAEPDEALSLWLADAFAPALALEVVGTARDGESALDVVRRLRPDVVLVDVDIVMPPQGGVTLVEAIAEAIPGTVLLVLAAGEALEETARSALAVGATGVLAKDGSAQIPADLTWSDTGEGRATSSVQQQSRAGRETAHRVIGYGARECVLGATSC